jgi:F-type H+-transporting ATPase subunit gamma
MPSSLKQIKNRIRTIENTKKVTSAMELISVVKLSSTTRNFYAFKPYSLKLESMAKNLTAVDEACQHPFLEKRKEIKKILLCVIASDNGLCGFYNHGIIRSVEEFIKSRGPDKCSLVVVGKKGLNYFKRKGMRIEHQYLGLNGRYDDIISDGIANILINFFVSRKADEVHVAHMHFETAAHQEICIEQLLPIELPAGKQTYPIIEPDAASLLCEFLPKCVQMKMRRIFMESFTCEHAARSLSMKKATDNAKEMLDNLVLMRNKIRQASITQDIMEVISSAEALKG